jgi:predicted ATPase/DNA-binding CsgD family transcriptional regulator
VAIVPHSSVIGSVPADIDTFVGRDAELAQLQLLGPGARLLTMLGPAGVGKTRLARRLAHRLRPKFPDGVWYVDLTSVVDARLLPHTLARMLDVRPNPGQLVLEALVGRLQDRKALLILDACERMLDESATLACTLRDGCPSLHILAISREVLDATGDTIWRTPPLSVPAPTANATEVSLADSVHLLVLRARQHNARLTVTRSNSARIAEICRCLGGMPLALELAAAQLHTRNGPQLPLESLRRLPDRQHILRTALEWAYARLTPPQQALLRRLSVFAGAWDGAGAGIVCAGRALKPSAIAPALERLVAAALLIRDPADPAKRYRMLDSVREFASERLRESDEEQNVRRRYVLHMLNLAERMLPEALNADHAALLESEIDNIRAALTSAIGAGDGEYALRLATAACSLWYYHGHFTEGCEWLERSLALTNHRSADARARAAAWFGQLLQFRGELSRAEHWLKVAAQLHQANGNPLGSAFAAAMLGQLTLMRGDMATAYVVCNEAADSLEALGEPLHVAGRLQVVVAAIELGSLEKARIILEHCKRQAVLTYGALDLWLKILDGRLAAASGNLSLARLHLEGALELGRAVQEQSALVTALVELGIVELESHATLQARGKFVEAIGLAQRSGERIQLARALDGLACTVFFDQPTGAVRLVGAADHLRALMGARPWPSDTRRVGAWLRTARRVVPSVDYQAAWREGQSMDVDEAVRLTRTLAHLEAPGQPAPALTARERQIVRLLARALTNDQIASELSIRPATARTHVEHVMLKLGLHRRAELVLWASQQSSGTQAGGL